MFLLLSFLQQWDTNRLLDCTALGSSTSDSSQVSFTDSGVGIKPSGRWKRGNSTKKTNKPMKCLILSGSGSGSVILRLKLPDKCC